MADATNDYPTTIGADAVFKGQLQFDKGVRLLGRFEGEITSGGQLLVAEGANLTGDVKASAVRIDGEIKGNIDAESRVQLSSSARLEGDLQTQRLEVAEGAVLIGRCVVGVNGKARGGADGRTVSAPVQSVTPGKPKAVEPAPTMAGKK